LRWFVVVNRWPAWLRWPFKSLALATAVLLVCFPDVPRLVRHVQRWTDPNRLIAPDAEVLQPWADELRPQLTDDLPPQAALKTIEHFVYDHLPYEWDWKNWSNADYIPTVEEALARGREDCDGRAVVAASLLSRLGYPATLVTDFSHVWVRTEFGDTMSPGQRVAVVATERGIALRLTELAQLPHALGYGVSVFYLHRELIIVLAAWLVLLRPRRRWWRNLLALALLLAALVLVRAGGGWQEPNVALEWLGLFSLAAAFAAASGWRQRGGAFAPSAMDVGSRTDAVRFQAGTIASDEG